VRSQLNARTLGGNNLAPLMTQQIEVVSPLTPSDVLDRLARYGAEWRESKIPSKSRGEFYGCRITVRGHEFELQLEPQPHGPVFVWRGDVVPDSSNGGSRLRARARQLWWSKVFSVCTLALLIGWSAWPELFGAGRSVDGAVFAIGSTCFFLILMLVFASGRAGSQRYVCEAIFAQVLGGTTDSRAVAP
jgi:hypothetical protein